MLSFKTVDVMFYRWLGGGLTALAFWMYFSAGTAQQPLDSRLTEPIEAIHVTVQLADLGDADQANDKLAIDLGLGFPLWLSPAIDATEQATNVGALPAVFQRSKADGDTVITATFAIEAQPASDLLDVTRPLLSGLQVCDISRVGVILSTDADVTLRSLQIDVNGKELYRREGIDETNRTAREQATAQQGDAAEKLATVMSQISDIQAFADVGLASEGDLEALQRLLQSRQELEHAYAKAASVLDGRYPFFVEDDFASSYRSAGRIGSGAVTLVTADHTAAGTDDRVFLQLGGKKFLLDQPVMTDSVTDQPLDPLGVRQAFQATQRFELDLLSAPLTASDVRGFAIGQLSSGSPGSLAPDRWHPVRVLVELDGRVVFDSDESDVNRKSLKAIRLIPQVHLDAEGKPVRTPPTSRECSLWKAGYGQGLDLDAGGTLPMPPPGDPDEPFPEPPPDDFGDASWGTSPGDDAGSDPSFPGETPPPGNDPWAGNGGGSPGDAGEPGWHPWPSDPQQPGGSGPGGISPGFWNLMDHVVVWLLGKLPPLSPGTDAKSHHDKFALEQVRVTTGWRQGDTFHITWDTSGNLKAIDHYDVRMTVVHPDQKQNVFGPEVFASAKVPAIDHSIDVKLLDDALYFIPKDAFYIAPIVTAVPKDPKQSPHERTGPAHLVFPANSPPLEQPTLQSVYMAIEGPPGGPATSAPHQIEFQEPADLNQSAVWIAGELDSQNAILFADARPGINCVVRPSSTSVTHKIILTLIKEGIMKKHEFAAQLAFLGQNSGGNEVTVRVFCTLRGANNKKPFDYPPKEFKLTDTGGGDPAPTFPISMIVDEADSNFGEPTNLTVTLVVETSKTDPVNPPVLLGMSLAEIP